MKAAMAISCFSIALCMTLPAAAAGRSVPDWTYDAMKDLASTGCAVLPDKDIQALSRPEMAMLTAKILKRLDDGTPKDLQSEYALLARLGAKDEIEYKLLQEKTVRIEAQYKATFDRMKGIMEKIARISAQGNGRDLEKMKALKAQETELAAKLEGVAAELAIAKVKLPRRKMMLDKWQEKKDLIIQKLSVSVDDDPAAYAAEREVEAAARLRVEFAPELMAMGYFDDEAAQQQAEIQVSLKTVRSDRLHVDGEARLDYGRNTGAESIGDRARMRLRLYPDYDIDGNWHAAGMVESEKTVQGKDTGSNMLALDRYYLAGKSGATLLNIGAFGATMADGNIYDSKFQGIQASTGTAVKYKLQLGEMDMAHSVFSALASYDVAGSYGLDAGYYHFNIAGTASSRNIYMANLRKPMGWLNFGAMYLRGTDTGVAGSGNNGYVFTLEHGKEDSWNPGAYRLYTKYYYQPATTYVEHTMNGMADYMQGFRGYGLGLSYTLRKDLVGALEYDSLKDLLTDSHNNTIWGGITYYFSNYEQ